MGKSKNPGIPLAERLRPKTLADFVGQEHLVGPGKPLRAAIENKHKFSFILWGPPGCGKTTLARIYASSLGAEFVNLSAVAAGKEDIKKSISLSLSLRKSAVLFLDEIHRFNKAQQDYLLPYVEDGTLTLVGATTENPSFEVISPLLSRCRVFTLRELNKEELKRLASSVQQLGIKISEKVIDLAAELANGDARQFINLVEVTHRLYGKVTEANLYSALSEKRLRYDKLGEEHYNTISAFIKSMRAGDTDAAIYYLARMVDAGEDPLFIARRMVVFASEDVASPTALVVADAVFRACETVGLPECQENLAAGTVFLSQAKKDRRAYEAYMQALDDVKRFGNLPIPLKIRNPVTKLMKELGYGAGYQKYSKTSLLPEQLKDRKYFK